MYHTGVNRKILPFLKKKKIWENKNGFEVWEHTGRWYLVRGDFLISELLSGKDTFTKKYKGDYHKWITDIEKKDRKKIEGIYEKIEQLKLDIDVIQSIWN